MSTTIIQQTGKHVKDPVWCCVKAALEKRLKDLEEKGPSEELELSRKRYGGMVRESVSIEPAIVFPDGTVRVCIACRSSGFARVDIDIERVTFERVMEEFGVPLRTCVKEDLEELVKTPIKTGGDLIYITDTDEYLVLLDDPVNMKYKVRSLFQDILFNSIVYTSGVPAGELGSGKLTIEDPAIGTFELPLLLQTDVIGPGENYTLVATITSLRNGVMTVVGQLKDNKSGDFVENVEWEYAAPAEYYGIENNPIKITTNANNSAITMLWTMIVNPSTNMEYGIAGNVNISGVPYHYETIFDAPAIKIKSVELNQQTPTTAELTVTLDNDVGKLLVYNDLTIVNAKGEFKADVRDIKILSNYKFSFLTDYEYDYIEDRTTYFKFTPAAEDQLYRPLPFDTKPDFPINYKLFATDMVPKTDIISGDYDLKSEQVQCKVFIEFDNSARVFNPTTEFSYKVGDEYKPLTSTPLKYLENGLWECTLDGIKPEDLSRVVNIKMVTNFPDYIDVESKESTKDITIPGKGAPELSIDISDLNLGVSTLTISIPVNDEVGEVKFKDVELVGFDNVVDYDPSADKDSPKTTEPSSNEYKEIFKGYLPLSKKAQTKISVKGICLYRGFEYPFEKEITRTLLRPSQWSGSVIRLGVVEVSPGGEGLRGKFRFSNNCENEVTKDGKSTITAQKILSTKLSSYGYKITTTAPVYDDYNQNAKIWIMAEQIGVPNSSDWWECEYEVRIAPPNNATGLIFEPDGIYATNVEYQYDMKYNVFWNDTDKTPLKNYMFWEKDVVINNGQTVNFDTVINDTGSLLKLNRLDNVKVDKIIFTGMILAMNYIASPRVTMRMRYGFDKETKLHSSFSKQLEENTFGTYELIDERGNTIPINEITDVKIEPGITLSQGKPIISDDKLSFKVKYGIVNAGSPAVGHTGFTNFSASINGTTYTSSDELTYKPLVLESITATQGSKSGEVLVTVKLPEGTLTAESVGFSPTIKGYPTENDGPVPVWNTEVSNWTVIDDRTVTFTCAPFENGVSTTYEIWLNNKEDLLSAIYNKVMYKTPKE